MPFYRRDSRIIHHIAIPKTATSSIEALLTCHGWEKDLDLLEKIKIKHPGLGNHAHFEIYNELNINPEFEFTTVRNPVSRFVSTVYFLRSQWSKGLGGIPEKTPDPGDIMPHHFITFMHSLFTKLIPEMGVNAENNIYLPQNKFISEKTEIFKCENNGLDSLLERLRSLDIVSKKSLMPRINPSVEKSFVKKSPDWNYSKSVSDYFLNFYKKDFKIFNYKMPKL